MADLRTFDQTRDIDAWRTRIDAHLDDIRAGLLDLIDCGLPDEPDPVLHEPTEAQRAMTRNEKATPVSPRVNTGDRSDPPAKEVLRWSHAIWQALVDVDELVGTWLFHTAPAELDLPAAPVQLEAAPDPELEGRIAPQLHPRRASRLLLARIGWTDQTDHHDDGEQPPRGWLPAAAAAIADAWAGDDSWRTKAWSLESATHSIARRHGRDATDQPDRCDNPHGLTPHPTDRPGICTWCAAADSIRRCDDRYGYGCDEFIVDRPRTFTCNPCQQKAYRDRRDVFAEAWAELP